MSEGPQFLDEPAKPARRDTSAPPRPAPNEIGWVDGAIEVEETAPHGPLETLAPRTARAGSSALYVGLVALLVLIAGTSALELANFVTAQFERSAWLGALTLGIIVPACGALVWSIVREWRGYLSLATIEQLRKGLSDQDIAVVRANAKVWLNRIQASAETRKGVDAAPDVATLRAILQAGPLARLERETSEAGRAAALHVMVATAVSPWPALDGVIVVWRSLGLVREIARRYGLRPGTAGTLRLFHRVTLDAATVVGTEVAVTALTEALLTNSSTGALVGHATGSGVAARRMFRLALAVGRACRPL